MEVKRKLFYWLDISNFLYIIVLLILAGVTIAMLSGNNSAPQKATEAAQKDAIAGAKDEIAMEVQEALLNYYNNTYVKGNGTDGASTQSVVEEAAGRAVDNAKSRNKQLLPESEVANKIITLKTKSYTVTGEIDENGGITWSDYVESTGSSGSETGGTDPETEVIPEVGDTVNYAPSGSYKWDKSLAESTMSEVGSGIETLSSEENGDYRITKWKILSYDPDSKMVEMVPTKPVGKLTLSGAQGYNNAVYLLNNACKSLYGNEGKGIEARSIQEEDFVKAGGENWTSHRANYENQNGVTNSSGSTVKYGEQKNGAYTGSYKNYPSIYEQENNSVITPTPEGITKELDQSDQKASINATDGGATNGYKTAGTSIQPYQTYYNTSDYSTTQGLLGDKAGILLPNGGSTRYWVASRCVDLDRGFCNFDVCRVLSGYLYASYSIDSGGSTAVGSIALFPVVSLSSKLLVDGEEPNTYDVKID